MTKWSFGQSIHAFKVIDRGGGDNLKEFVIAGVNAYALGCTEEGLELMHFKDYGLEIECISSKEPAPLKFTPLRSVNVSCSVHYNSGHTATNNHEMVYYSVV